MPQRSVYIREEDDAKWQALENKAAWIHDWLNLEIDKKRLEMSMPATVIQTSKSPNLNKNLCEHYQRKGECLVKGCKYA